jgi:hypothetical protein
MRSPSVSCTQWALASTARTRPSRSAKPRSAAIRASEKRCGTASPNGSATAVGR